MTENRSRLFIDHKGRMMRVGGGEQPEPTKGQKILDQANRVLREEPFRGIRYKRGWDLDTKSGPVVIVQAGIKKGQESGFEV